MAPSDRMTTIRLPLQIGTSSLWSVARSSAFFPGLLLVGLAVYAVVALWSYDRVAIGVGGALLVAGGMLIYYAWRHARLALDERPSDVLISPRGLRIEGGSRHGLELPWSEIKRESCETVFEKDDRFVLWRVLVNIPLLAISIAGEGDATIEFTEKVPVKRLYIATRQRGRLLFAEGDIPIELESLDTLLATIRSPRWYGEHTTASKKKAPKQESGEAPAIRCSNCGASVAPSGESNVACPYCQMSVPIPDDVRERVAAAAEFSKKRRSGFDRLTRLLESQPSAGFANTAILLAAVPIALAWPVAGFLAFRAWEMSLGGWQRLVSLMLFPLLLTFGAFLLARGRLADRFALHAVVVGFGAREPERPSEPYRCRACDGALPAAQGSPVVRCVYCKESSVIGLDLRGDAEEVATEHVSLDAALAKRTRERVLWTLGSLLALALLALAYVTLRKSLAARPPAAVTVSAPIAGAESKVASPGPSEAPMSSAGPEPAAGPPVVAFDAVVTSSRGPVPFAGRRCVLRVVPFPRSQYNCRVLLTCDDTVVYGVGSSGWDHCEMDGTDPVSVQDVGSTPTDGDPALAANLASGTATLSDTLPSGDRYTVSFRLAPSGNASAPQPARRQRSHRAR